MTRSRSRALDIGLASVIALILGGCASPEEPVVAEETQAEVQSAATLTIIHINDTHEHLDQGGPRDASLHGTRGGIARAYRVIEREKRREPGALLLHAGDLFQGSIFFNAYTAIPEIRLLQALGCDAMAVGNHDLDLGPDALLQTFDAGFGGGAGFPLLSSNLDLSQTPDLAGRVHPYVMKQVSGIRVGIFGMTVPDPLENVPPGFVGEDLVGSAQASVDALRAAGADVVIGLTHLGGLDEVVAENVTGIDLIIGGHSHEVLRTPRIFTDPNGHQTPVFQAGAFYEHVGEVTLRVTKSGNRVTAGVVGHRMIDIDDTLPPDPIVAAIVDLLKIGVERRYGRVFHDVLATATQPLTRAFDASRPDRDTALGSLVVDAFRARTGTDVALTTLGLISEDVYQGPILADDVFKSLSYGVDPETGFGYPLVTFALSGADLVGGLEIALAGPPGDFFPQISGATFAFDPDAPPFGRVDLATVTVGGEPLDPGRMYTVTGDLALAMVALESGLDVEDMDVLSDTEAPVVADFVSTLGTIAGYGGEGRIRDESVGN